MIKSSVASLCYFSFSDDRVARASNRSTGVDLHSHILRIALSVSVGNLQVVEGIHPWESRIGARNIERNGI